jgi:hypothetical protein
MKNSILSGFNLLSFIFFISCQKEETVETSKTVRIEVKAYKTGNPVVGAEVTYLSNDLARPGSMSYTVLFSGKTDENGYCEVPESVYRKHDKIEIGNADGYFGISELHTPETQFTLNAIGQVRIHLVKTSNFPNAFKLEISEFGEWAPASEIHLPELYSLPADSSFVNVSYGGQTNTICWSLSNEAADILSAGYLYIDVPETGIGEAEIKY